MLWWAVIGCLNGDVTSLNPIAVRGLKLSGNYATLCVGESFIQGVSRVMVVRRGYDSSSHSKTEILYTHMLVFALF